MRDKTEVDALHLSDRQYREQSRSVPHQYSEHEQLRLRVRSGVERGEKPQEYGRAHNPKKEKSCRGVTPRAQEQERAHARETKYRGEGFKRKSTRLNSSHMS